MNENELQQTLEKFDKELPHFPDGRIDYSNADTALAVGIIVLHRDEVLLVRRSQDVSFYPCKWNWISGFIDRDKPLKEFVYQELREETGITPSNIEDMFTVPRIEITDKEIGMTWLIYPVVVTITDRIDPELNWEADDFAWIVQDDIEKYDTVPGVAENITATLKQYNPHD